MAASVAMCRLCLEENDPKSSGEELIAPCMCAGSHQYVHRSCLDNWRLCKAENAFTHCTTCKAQYHLRPVLEDGCWPKVKFCIFKAVDFLIVFIPIQLIISMLGGLAHLKLESFRRSIEIFSNHPILFYYGAGALQLVAVLGIAFLLAESYNCYLDFHIRHWSLYNRYPCYEAFECIVYVLSHVPGFIIIAVYLGIIYLRRIWKTCTETKLTKAKIPHLDVSQLCYASDFLVFVVEDLHGNYTPPNQDQQLTEKLRSRKLI